MSVEARAQFGRGRISNATRQCIWRQLPAHAADFAIGADGVVLVALHAEVVWDHLPFATIDGLYGLNATA